MAKIIHIAVLIDDINSDYIYRQLNDQLSQISIIKDYAFNGRWHDYTVNDNYRSGDFIRSLDGM